MSARQSLRNLFAHFSESKVINPVLIFAVGIAVATILQAWLGYRASRQWRTNARMVVERRADEVASLLTISLLRDMRGAYESLAPVQMQQVLAVTPQELSDIVARVFARFPYADSFFMWREKDPEGNRNVMFSRSDRPPVWDKVPEVENSFPVTIVRSSNIASMLVSHAKKYARPADQFVFFDAPLEGVDYQIVARIFRTADASGSIAAILGFGVNMDWVRQKYFSEFTEEMERLLGQQGATTLSLTIEDETGNVLARTRPESERALFQEKRFPLAFFDSSVLSLSALEHVNVQRWTARVSAADDPLLTAADAGAKQTGILSISAALISLVGLVLGIRFLRMNLDLFAIKADFVAMVSHELKTPLASISLVGQALSKGRCKPDQIPDYGAVLTKESSRLTRLVENLLNVSRVTDSKPFYSFKRARIRDLIEEAVSRLQTQADEMHVSIAVEIEDPVEFLVCDPEAMTQALENVIDNAVKYSDPYSSIDIGARSRNHSIHIAIRDRGRGIPSREIPLVFKKFFRGRGSSLNGTGIGLSIARKIVDDHGGKITIDSAVNAGTVVNIVLPENG